MKDSEILNEALQKVTNAIIYFETNNLTNSQIFIDFLDELNDLSVRY